MPGSVLLHVLPILPTQKRRFFVMAGSRYRSRSSSHNVNKMNNLERLTDRLFYRRSEEAGKTIESSRFSPPAFGLLVLPPVIMEDISSKWNFSVGEACAIPLWEPPLPDCWTAWPWLQRKASRLHEDKNTHTYTCVCEHLKGEIGRLASQSNPSPKKGWNVGTVCIMID